MELKLAGKTALVTGSTKGIGKAIAQELARAGVNVLINGRDNELVASVVAEIKAQFPETSPQNATADLVNPQERDALIARYPKVDLLINSMGIYELMAYEEITDEVWHRYFETNFLVANHLTQRYLPEMRRQNFGRVVFIASEEAVMPGGQMPQYAVTKTMVASLAKSLSKLTAGTEVTINTVMPGPTLSENVYQIIDSLYGEELDFEEKERQFMTSNLPQSELGRFIRPEEIGRLVAFVSSPYGSAFRGAAIRMDGGLVPTIF